MTAPPSGLTELSNLGVALGLTALIGLERQVREKSAGLRTHAVIGLGASLFVLVSKYGFFDVLDGRSVQLDPSRVAAQIASGIGFVGAGLIFVRRGDVKGLTSAAGVWLSAAIGAAAGAGLFAAALLGTGGYFVVALALTASERALERYRSRPLELDLVYPASSGTLARALEICEAQGYDRVSLRRDPASAAGAADDRAERHRARVVLRGRGSPAALLALLSDVPGMVSVRPSERLDGAA